MMTKIRTKHRRTLAIALLILLVNIAIILYEEYITNVPGDILRQQAVMDELGPPLPPDDIVERLIDHFHQIPKLSNSTSNNKTDERLELPGHIASTSKVNKFLVYSYMKSGASKVAELINLNHKEIFYMHHPLDSFDKDHLTPGINILTRQKSEEGMDWLTTIYNCSFQEQHEDLLSETELWKSHALRNTYKAECKNLKITKCLERACKQRPIRAITTLRLGMNYIHQLMESFNNEMKVILVLRDPRDILGNRRRHHIGKLDNPKNFLKQALHLCKTMGRDVKYAEKIAQDLPASIMVLHYEHLILQPREVITYVYKFLGLKVSNDRFQKILTILGLHVSEDQRLETTKAWQLELTLQESRAVDMGCKHEYKNLGYFPVPNQISAYDKYFIDWNKLPLRKRQKIRGDTLPLKIFGTRNKY